MTAVGQEGSVRILEGQSSPELARDRLDDVLDGLVLHSPTVSGPRTEGDICRPRTRHLSMAGSLAAC
ncbi:hypothetical protein GM708_11345 [Vibrio cholerae]|nr:hypothetical protein [Vibrio cholerae]